MKLALFGYGQMGKVVETVARERGHEITLILDEFSNEGGSGISKEALAGARMAIDFSISSAVRDNVRRAAEIGVDVVVGTTGWQDDREVVEQRVRDAGTALLHAPNFSVGMLLFTRIVRDAVRRVNGLGEYDVHLFESHHRLKTDHPSGTARRLAELIVEELDRKSGWTSELTEGASVDPETLQVAVARVGSVPGIHAIGIEGPDDGIELRHVAPEPCRVRARCGTGGRMAGREVGRLHPVGHDGRAPG